MDKKILIFEDTGAKNQFIANCETTAAQANDLIGYYETFQDLAVINTSAEFEQLVADPILYYDETLRTGLNLQATGNRTPDPETLARLYAYERSNYIAVISGLPVTQDCGPCKSSRIIKRAGKPAITSARWEAYRDYLTFTPSGFVLNDEAITEYCQKFNYYATEPKQLEVVELFNQLIDALNKFDEMTPLRQTDKENLTRMFKIGIERPPFDGKFLIEPRMLMELVFKY
jgi:hypothetical protein